MITKPSGYKQRFALILKGIVHISEKQQNVISVSFTFIRNYIIFNFGLPEVQRLGQMCGLDFFTPARSAIVCISSGCDDRHVPINSTELSLPHQKLTLRHAQGGAFLLQLAELPYLAHAHVRIADNINRVTRRC